MQGRGSITGGGISITPDVRSKEHIFVADMGREIATRLSDQLDPFYAYVEARSEETKAFALSAINNAAVARARSEATLSTIVHNELAAMRLALEAHQEASTTIQAAIFESIIILERRTLIGWTLWKLDNLRAWWRNR